MALSRAPIARDIVLSKTKGAKAHEALSEGRFSLAADLLADYLQEVSDDLPVYLQYGDCLICRGRLPEAVEAYVEYAQRGGDQQKASDHLVRGVAALCGQIAAAPILRAEDLTEACVRLAGDKWFGDVSQTAADLVEQWNGVRRGFERRKTRYHEAFAFLKRPSDLVFAIPPYINFWSGYPPYGVGVLQDYLQRRGKSCPIADLNLELYHAGDEPWKAWWKAENQPSWSEQDRFLTGLAVALQPDIDELARILAQASTAALGFACFQVNRPFTLRLLPRIKAIRPETFVVLGGPDCFYPDQCVGRYSSVLQHVDAFVVGEGEIATRELLDALARHSDPTAIPGVYVPSRQRKEQFRRPAVTPVEDLKGFPKFDPSYIERIPEPRRRLVSTNRGCVNRCDFCYDRKTWRKFRLRDPVDVVDELAYNIETYGVRDFHLVDSATNSSSKQLDALCDLMARRTPGISLSASMMISGRLTPAVFKKMRLAGFTRVYYGLESGSAKVLKAMRKPYDPQEAGRILRLSHNAGIRNEIFLMVGHPSEDEEEFQETLRFVRQNRKAIDLVAMVSMCFALQETDLAELLAKKGVELPEAWYGFGSWIDGDNHILERIRRKEILLEEARTLGIPTNEADRRRGSALWRRIWKRLARPSS